MQSVRQSIVRVYYNWKSVYCRNWPPVKKVIMIDFKTIFSTSDSRSIFQVRSNFAHAVAVIQPSISLVIVFINKINTVFILPPSTIDCEQSLYFSS